MYCKYTPANFKNKELFYFFPLPQSKGSSIHKNLSIADKPALCLASLPYRGGLEGAYIMVDFLNSIFSFFTDPGNLPPT
jgi:hypothetical protein